MCLEELQVATAAPLASTLKPRPPFPAVASTLAGDSVLEAIPALGQARNEDSIAKSCTQRRHDELYTLLLLLIAHTKFSAFKYHRFSEY